MAYSFIGGKFREVDALGLPLAGGLLYTYAAGTLTPLATYTDAGGASPNTNPVVLDASGRADVFLGTSSYRMILKSALGITIWDEDNIVSGGSIVSGLSSTTDATKGAGQVGVNQSLAYSSGTVGDFLRRGFVPGPAVSGGNDTTNIAAAIALAVSLNIPLWTGAVTYSINQLVLPSNLVWYAGNTKLTQISGTNLCALRNTNETFSTRTDSNIRILGALTVDCNGLNQADTEASGVLTAGVRFTGVANLELNLTVLNPRRYGIWLIGCSGVRGNPTVVHNVSIPSVNKDGVHINGGIVGTTDVRFGVVTVQNGGDDALPLNADDVASGGSWTQANITGKIYDVHVDRLALTNCRNGVRLLSATQEIANVFIGQITGDVSVYAWNVQDYGLGSNSWYKNIRCNSISVDYKDNPIGATLGLINIDTSNPNTQAISDFWFGNIDRGQVGTVGKDRETVQLKLKRCIVDLNRVIERYCSNTATVTMTGGGGASELYLRDWMAVNSAQNGSSFWRVAVSLNSVTGLDLLKIGRVNVDFVRNLVVATSSPIGLLDIETFPVTTPANGALSFSGAATVISKLICRNPDTTNLSATFRYTLASGATVTKEWPPYNSGTTSQRPTASATFGDLFYDATINKPIWFAGGTTWKDATGATV